MYGLTNYLLHLDFLRQDSNLSIERFVEGVCSPRQYHRYINGTNQISYDKFISLCSRLNLSLNDFYTSYNKLYNSEFNRVYDLYLAISKLRISEAKRMYLSLKKSNFTDDESLRFFEFCEILFFQKQKKITDYASYRKYSKLIEYDQFSQKIIITFIDILCLVELAKIENITHRKTAILLLHDVLTDRKRIYVSSNTRYILPDIFYFLSKLYGLNNDIINSIQIANEGVKYCIRINDMNALEQLYYLLAIGYFKQGNLELAEENRRNCLYVCKIKKDQSRYTRFKSLLDKDFSVK